MKDDKKEIRHAAIPEVPDIVWPRLAKDAEEKPMAVQVVGHILHTTTLVVGQCVDGSVKRWQIRCPVSAKEVDDEIRQLQQDHSIPRDAIQFRTFEYAPDGSLH